MALKGIKRFLHAVKSQFVCPGMREISNGFLSEKAARDRNALSLGGIATPMSREVRRVYCDLMMSLSVTQPLNKSASEHFLKEISEKKRKLPPAVSSLIFRIFAVSK